MNLRVSTKFYLLLFLLWIIEAALIVADRCIGNFSDFGLPADHSRRMHTVLFLFQVLMPGAGCCFLAIFFHRQITSPLKEMQMEVNSLACEGHINSSDDIGDLVKSIRLSNRRAIETRRQERATIDNAVDVICLLDASGRFTSVNAATNKIFGEKPQDLIGKSLADFLVLEDVDESLSKTIGAEQSIDTITFENRWKRRDGRIVNLLWSAHWSATDKGLFCVVHDITERKLAEELLRESEERLRLILTKLPVAIMIISDRGHIEFVNFAGETLTRYTCSELDGKHICLVLGERLISQRQPLLNELIEECTNGMVAATVTAKTGENVATELSMSRFLYRGQTKFLVAALDVTARYELEKLKREFVAMISHDLRTPLASIFLVLTTLEDDSHGTISPEGKIQIVQTKNEIERLTRLIGDLLDMEKMQSGHFSMHFENTPISSVVRASVDAVRKIGELRQVSIEIPVEDAVCQADGGRLIQVLINLLSNAIKFSPRGAKVRILLEESPHQVKVSVIDRGRGIPPDKVEWVFERFKQVDQSDWRSKGGVGLGLAICKSIIEHHQGRIGVESIPGDKTTFWFTIAKSRS